MCIRDRIGVSSPTGPTTGTVGRPLLSVPAAATGPAARPVPTEPSPRVRDLPYPEPATSLLGRDEVPVVGLTALNHIHLHAAAPLPHLTCQCLCLGQIRSLAVVTVSYT